MMPKWCPALPLNGYYSQNIVGSTVADSFERKTRGEYSSMTSVDGYFELWVLLHQTRDTIYSAREKELRRYGITTMEAGALFIIQKIGKGATPAEISRWMLRKPHTTSGLLNRMEKKGLILQTKDLARKNMIRVSITKKGKQAYKDSTQRESIHRILSTLSEEERHKLKSYLQTLRDRALEDINIDCELPFPPLSSRSSNKV